MSFPKCIHQDDVESYIKEWLVAGRFVDMAAEMDCWVPYGKHTVGTKAIAISREGGGQELAETGYVRRRDGWWVQIPPERSWSQALEEAEKYELPKSNQE